MLLAPGPQDDSSLQFPEAELDPEIVESSAIAKVGTARWIQLDTCDLKAAILPKNEALTERIFGIKIKFILPSNRGCPAHFRD